MKMKTKNDKGAMPPLNPLPTTSGIDNKYIN